METFVFNLKMLILRAVTLLFFLIEILEVLEQEFYFFKYMVYAYRGLSQ